MAYGLTGIVFPHMQGRPNSCVNLLDYPCINSLPTITLYTLQRPYEPGDYLWDFVWRF